MFQHHGLPPKKGSRYPYFTGYAVSVAIDILLTFIFCYHILRPMTNFKSLGIAFFFCLPGVTILAPALGALACLTGWPSLLKHQSSCNSSAVLLNYPITLFVMLMRDEDPFYVVVIVALWLNKILISYAGSKVRQHWLNPGFTSNYEKINDRFRSLVQAQYEVQAGIKNGMNELDRAYSLVNSAMPYLGAKKSAKKKVEPIERIPSVGVSDDEESDDDEDDTSFGIIPKSRIGYDDRQRMSEF